MNEECLICGAALKYLEKEADVECAICGKIEKSRTLCIEGHYVCNDCHMQGMDVIMGICLSETSRDPITIINKMMNQEFCHMHGPEHHVMVGSALLTAYKNAGGNIDLKAALMEMQSRGRQVPGGACGFWGACGAGVSSGIFVSIITGSTPLSEEVFGLANRMTSESLRSIGETGGPRCCKRDSFLSIRAAVGFVRENLGITMELSEIRCSFSRENNQCIGARCPFS